MPQPDRSDKASKSGISFLNFMLTLFSALHQKQHDAQCKSGKQHRRSPIEQARAAGLRRIAAVILFPLVRLFRLIGIGLIRIGVGLIGIRIRSRALIPIDGQNLQIVFNGDAVAGLIQRIADLPAAKLLAAGGGKAAVRQRDGRTALRRQGQHGAANALAHMVG